MKQIRSVLVSAIVVLLSCFFVASSYAVTIGPIGPNLATVTTLSYPDDYLGSALIKKAVKPAAFTHVYHLKSGNTAGVLDAFNFSGTAGIGFTALTLTLKDITNSVVLGSINVLTAAVPIYATLTTGNLYDLIVTGKATANSTSTYSFAISAVPVPPALLLLVSGLCGVGFMGRRKKSVAKISV